MNIFWLDEDLTKCAEMHNSRHVIKQILEYAQLLSTTHHVLDGLDSPIADKIYKSTHRNHPCAVWVRESYNNYCVTWCLLVQLCKEYTYRYGKIHKTESEKSELLMLPPANIKLGGITPKPVCMPDECKIYVDGALDIVASYRNYYCMQKQHLASWKNREAPYWYTGELKC